MVRKAMERWRVAVEPYGSPVDCFTPIVRLQERGGGGRGGEVFQAAAELHKEHGQEEKKICL